MTRDTMKKKKGKKSRPTSLKIEQLLQLILIHAASCRLSTMVKDSFNNSLIESLHPSNQKVSRYLVPPAA